MRWVVRIIVAVIIIVVVAVGALYAIGSAKLDQKYAVMEPPLSIPTDPARIARGKHFATALAKCVDCHGANLGGRVFLEAPPFRVVAPNLTRGSGGAGASLTDTDYVRAIRDGVAPDGRGLMIMPADAYLYLSDADLADIIAYVRSVPPVNSQLPETDIRPLGRILLGAGQLPPPAAAVIDHAMAHPAAMTPAVTVDYGQYLARTGGCIGCHGAGLSGGAVPGVPPDFPKAQNITPTGIGQWTDGQLVHALRVGKRPDGSTIDPFMPWQYTALMSDTEMAALVKYLRSVPPRPTGTH